MNATLRGLLLDIESGNASAWPVLADFLEEHGKGVVADLRNLDALERVVEFSPAWDRRSEGYGQHGAEMRFVVKGRLGAVQFLLYTNWPLSLAEGRRRANLGLLTPLPADLGYHSPKPIYEEQSISQEECQYLEGRPCYYDGSALNAEPVFAALIRHGDEAVWKHLEEYYRGLFKE